MGGRGCGAFVGLILLAAVVLNVSKLPYPMWFKVASLIAIPAATYFGVRLARRREFTAVSSAK
jgi:uncharacterized protein YacL